jgi:hypothetical protein
LALWAFPGLLVQRLVGNLRVPVKQRRTVKKTKPDKISSKRNQRGSYFICYVCISTYASLAEFEKALALLLEAPFASWRGSFSFLTALVNRAAHKQK